MIQGKTMNKIRISTILLVALVLLVSLFAVACGNNGGNSDSNGGNSNGGNNNGGNRIEYVDLQGYIRDVGFQSVAQAKICYDGEVKATSGEDGRFTVSVKREDYNLTTGKITVEGSPSLTYYDYNSQQLLIIKLEEGMEITDFYFISGKVVEYYNGETAVEGSVLCIDGTTVKTFSTVGNDRNFDLAFVHKDSVISAYKEGYTSHLELYGPEITGIRVGDIPATNETQSICVNGEEVAFKVIGGGFTFRLKSIDD